MNHTFQYRFVPAEACPDSSRQSVEITADTFQLLRELKGIGEIGRIDYNSSGTELSLTVALRAPRGGAQSEDTLRCDNAASTHPRYSQSG
jgi:hypothetical protein